jgi:hypothetical protein
MKQITNKTILKQGDKTYQPIEVDGVIYWVKSDSPYWVELEPYCVAQSQPKLDGIPVVNLKTFIARKQAEYSVNVWDLNAGHHFGEGFKSNTNQYTQADIEKAIKLARNLNYNKEKVNNGFTLSVEEILEQINSISIIEVDEQFNVISYGKD